MRIGAMAPGVCLAAVSLAPALAQPPPQAQPTQAQAAAIRSACRADFQALCASAPHAPMAALACLQQDAASLSPPCQTAVAAVGAPPATPAPPPPAATSTKAERALMRTTATPISAGCAMVSARSAAPGLPA